jgi:putative membrane protein
VIDGILAACDAALSSISLGFAIAGYVRRKDTPRHKRYMLIATAASFAFLIVFVVRFATFGFARTAGEGASHVAFLVLLFTHEPLAVINIPLVVAALVLGLRGAVAAHREVAPMALWIWLYVLASGIAIYFVLYT